MTYYKDGSPLKIGNGLARPETKMYGWLRNSIPVAIPDDQQDHLIYKALADSSNVNMTRGYHQCEFCGWEDSNYGNGEIWIKILGDIVIMPRMIWHYVQSHKYGLPKLIYSKILSNAHVVLTMESEEYKQTGSWGNTIQVPKIVSRARWKTSRYKNIGEFTNMNNAGWAFHQVIVKNN